MSVSGATSLGGNAMTQAVTSQFTTSGADACPCSLMETTTQPTLPDAGDSSAVTLGLKFKPSVDGFVRGVRYYRDTANTGTHIGKLFSAGGNELASVTIPTQGAGWQSANFSSPVSVSADTTYVISYYAPDGHYSASSGYFASPVVNLPLSSVGTGGVYANGNNFPNSSYSEHQLLRRRDLHDRRGRSAGGVEHHAGRRGERVEVDSVVKAKFDRAIERPAR